MAIQPAVARLLGEYLKAEQSVLVSPPLPSHLERMFENVTLEGLMSALASRYPADPLQLLAINPDLKVVVGSTLRMGTIIVPLAELGYRFNGGAYQKFPAKVLAYYPHSRRP